MGSRITVLNATALGSEVRLDGAVGSTMRVGGELLQPIGRGFMRRGPFLAPRASYVRSSENVYRDDEIAAIYNRQRASAGVDAGWLFGRDGQIRAGYEIGYVKNTARVGNVFPSAEGRENSFHAGFDIDRQDRAYFPSSGFRAHGGVRWFMDAPAAPESFGIVEGSLSSTWSIGKGRHLSVFADGGGNIGAEPPLLYQFGVGGPARLAAFAPNAFRGPKFLSGGVGIRTTIARLPGLLGDRLYATARTEIGAAFTSFDTARYRKSVTAGLEADTIFGPFFLGASVGDDRAFRAYFLVGKSVR
jgi:outer membrane protein assembly factor BamA